MREVGEGVEGFDVGQPVVATMGYGSHAELVSVPARAAWAVPDGLTVEQAAGVPIEYGTARRLPLRVRPPPSGGDRPRAGRRRRGRARRHPAGQGGWSHRLRDRVERRPSGSAASTTGSTTASTTPRPTWRARCSASPTSAASTSSSTRWAGSTLEASIASLAYRGRVSWVGRAGREERPPEVWPIMQKNGSITGVFLGAEMGMRPERTHAHDRRAARRAPPPASCRS